MRSISLVQKVEIDFKGTVFQNAVALVDVDNDGHNELCVSNTNGDLHIYKGIQSKQVWQAKGLGSVMVLCGGCLRDSDEVVLITLDREGRCHMFDAPNQINKTAKECLLPKDFSELSTDLRILSIDKLASNAKVAIVEDIDDDGVAELIIGSTDRFVRIYKWSIDNDNASPIGFNTFKDSYVDKEERLRSSSISIKDPREANAGPCPSMTTKQFNQETKSFFLPGQSSGACRTGVGHFVLVKEFSLFAQVGSIAVCRTDGLNQVIASQPNGGYCILGGFNGQNECADSPDSPVIMESCSLTKQESYPTFYPIRPKSTQLNHTGTEVIGGIKRQGNTSGVLAICTEDGYFAILDNSVQSNKHTVKRRSQHQWLTMSKLDVTRNGDEEVILCATSGVTYVIDKFRDIVCFEFSENVAAFCAGSYATDVNISKPCFCYVTLSGRIFLYYDVLVDTMKVKCVHEALINKIQQKPELAYLLDSLKLPNGEIDHNKVQNLVKNLWSEKLDF
ncbi:KICSTOR complex protein ITFG2 isoform X2 [Hydra vulgaris]|uniref:KICSTOR complex protein ITFG2 isoform X2 n=1 Tax=Hydra vulgaris TaxID=6087 RepID=A0ABM4BSW3_HYDVU